MHSNHNVALGGQKSLAVNYTRPWLLVDVTMVLPVIVSTTMATTVHSCLIRTATTSKQSGTGFPFQTSHHNPWPPPDVAT